MKRRGSGLPASSLSRFLRDERIKNRIRDTGLAHEIGTAIGALNWILPQPILSVTFLRSPL